MRRLLFLLCCLSCSMACQAGLSRDSSSAWIELKELTVKNRLSIRALFESKEKFPQTFKYVLEVEKQTATEKTTNLQGDDFDLAPGQRIKLTELKLNTSILLNFEVRLSVYNQSGKLIAADTVSKTPLTKQSPPKPNIFTEIAVPQSKAAAPDVEPELGGLIIDDTRSKSGRDFYDIFYKKWIAPNGITDFTIVIRELPARGRFAQVSLEVNDEPILKRFLHPQYDRIEEQANISIRFTRRHLSNLKAAKSELEDDDVEGSGIF